MKIKDQRQTSESSIWVNCLWNDEFVGSVNEDLLVSWRWWCCFE